MKATFVTLMASLALTGCATDRASQAPPAPVATAKLANASGEQRGTVLVNQGGKGLRVSIFVEGMTAGTYAAHVHAVGKCAAPDFTSAGGHWNPEMRRHGSANPAGPHKGDLPNLTVGADGRGTVIYDVVGVTLDGPTNGLFDIDGASVIIHQAADDYRTDPTGNAGGRQACGVVVRG